MNLLQELLQLNESAISGVGNANYGALVKLARKGKLKEFIDSFEEHANSSASMFLTAPQKKNLMKCVADGHEVRVLPFKSEEAVYRAEEDLEKKGWKLIGDGDNGGGSVEAIFTRGELKEEVISEEEKSKKVAAMEDGLKKLGMKEVKVELTGYGDYVHFTLNGHQFSVKVTNGVLYVEGYKDSIEVDSGIKTPTDAVNAARSVNKKWLKEYDPYYERGE